jgi:glycosyltransferase involved in cell wall biosynthesis
MKVLFLNPIGELGGAERGLLALIASLKKCAPQLEVSVLALGLGPLVEEARALGATARVLPLPLTVSRLGDSGGVDLVHTTMAGARLLVWLPALARQIRQEAPDILHSNGFKAHVLGALTAPRGTPLVWHLHDFVSERRLMRRLLPLVQERASAGIAVSEAVARDARKVLSRLRVTTVLNGVRTDHFRPGSVTPSDLDSLAGLPPAAPGTVRIGMVATLASWKGHELFIEATRKLRDPASRFYIVGGALYSTGGSQHSTEDLRLAVKRAGMSHRFGFVPFQRSIAPIYAALDVVVHASTRAEPFGMTVAEAMASGKPVVAAAAGGVLEQIEDGVTGLLFEPGAEAALCSHLERLVDSPVLRRSLGEAAARFASTHLDATRLGPETLRAYQNMEPPHRFESLDALR